MWTWFWYLVHIPTGGHCNIGKLEAKDELSKAGKEINASEGS